MNVVIASNTSAETDPTHEITLLEAARQGSMEAFEDLQIVLEPPIRRFVRRLMGSSAEEDDIVQDTFIALYMNMARIDPPENLRPYLFRIARNRCYDEMRSWGRREQMSLDDEPTHIYVSYTRADRISQPDEMAHWLLMHLEVQEAIDQLPDLQRQALILYAESDLTYAEIAEVMDCSLGTIKSRIYHAKQGLRRLLHPDTLAILDEELQ